MTVRFQDKVSVKGSMRKTSDGYLVGEVRVARTGIQQYHTNELGLREQLGDRLINVFRPESTVFDKVSMASYVGKPITLGHPSELVTADNWKQLAVGDMGEEIARDGEFVRVPIKLMDAAAIKAVDNDIRELSMGYSCGLEVKDGTTAEGEHYDAVQTGPLRINHLAIVPKARGGSALSIQTDGVDHWGATPVASSVRDHQQEKRTMNMQKVVVDGLTIETTDQGAEVIAKLLGKLNDAEKVADTAKATNDAKVSKLEAERDDFKTKLDAALVKTDQKVIDAAVLARVDLLTKGKALAPEVKSAGVTDADYRKAVVSAKLGDAVVAGKSEAYIDARFEILAEGLADGGSVLDSALSETVRTPVSVLSDKAAYDAAVAAEKKQLNSRYTQ
jgi:hypothetical protein